MQVTDEHIKRMENLTFSSVYPHYVNKVIRKDRTEAELLEVIEWLTGYKEQDIATFINEKMTFKTFFDKAKINPNAHLITGLICGYRIEDIEHELTKQVRWLDKLVDELAKGKKM